MLETRIHINSFQNGRIRDGYFQDESLCENETMKGRGRGGKGKRGEGSLLISNE